MKKSVLILLLSSSLALTACNSETESKVPKQKQEDHTSHNHVQQGDISETTSGIDVLPSFLAEVDPQIQDIYTIAGQHAELLESMPCYCGCGESVGHKSNKNCFIREIKETGEVVWDSHAVTCVNCLEIALESAKMKRDGKTDIAIRNNIDEKYREGYAKPTPTPKPKE
ncbi:PCYCGC motif-containing (lipo)protein [Bacillus manliponensis]|uniref:PCYCGC motif-containing (lipo)protein n=1 Tax=Bacillus manliponensis TaxID=574376 RepID=UPI00351639F7